jgi:hypothetical protein
MIKIAVDNSLYSRRLIFIIQNFPDFFTHVLNIIWFLNEGIGVGFLFHTLILPLNNVYLFWVLLFLIAMAIAFFVPMITTSFFPRVTPV